MQASAPAITNHLPMPMQMTNSHDPSLKHAACRRANCTFLSLLFIFHCCSTTVQIYLLIFSLCINDFILAFKFPHRMNYDQAQNCVLRSLTINAINKFTKLPGVFSMSNLQKPNPGYPGIDLSRITSRGRAIAGAGWQRYQGLSTWTN